MPNRAVLDDSTVYIYLESAPSPAIKGSEAEEAMKISYADSAAGPDGLSFNLPACQLHASPVHGIVVRYRPQYFRHVSTAVLGKLSRVDDTQPKPFRQIALLCTLSPQGSSSPRNARGSQKANAPLERGAYANGTY